MAGGGRGVELSLGRIYNAADGVGDGVGSVDGMQLMALIVLMTCR